MSKAILIIDVDDNADFENAIADITFRENEWGLAPRGIKRWHNGIKAKPLPMEAVNLEEVLHDDGLYYVEKIAPTDFDRGFNYCLEKILGEKIDE